jgi:hypothetical protein
MPVAFWLSHGEDLYRLVGLGPRVRAFITYVDSLEINWFPTLTETAAEDVYNKVSICRH